MHKFRVWAPEAQSVDVLTGDAPAAEKPYPLAKESGGWWQAAVPDAAAGTRYAFSLDGGKPMPDPRSPFQPEGVNGPSEVVDHTAFDWTDSRWQAKPLASAVIYELHVGTFTPQGTFVGAIERLDYLAGLGVTHLELMPVNEFSGNVGWGYDGVDLYAPHHNYGRPDDLKKLVDACHAKGLAVILDVVYNHLGPSGNYLLQYGPYFIDAYHTPWGSAVNFDHEGSVEVRRFFLENAVMWLRDYHFDGLRLDAVHAYYDRSAIHFLEALSLEVDALSSHLGRYFCLIAESDLNDPRVVTSREAGGFGIDAQWSDDFHHALHAVITGETDGYYEDFGALGQLAKALEQAFVYDGAHSSHRRRLHGRSIGHLSGHRFLAYAQNHDQTGNRARGERLLHLSNLRRAKMAAAIVLTSAYVPMLFQGEEFGASAPFQYFTHHEDPELAKSVSDGRRNEFRAFGWDPNDVPDPQERATFERSKLNWSELQQEPHAELVNWHKRLIALRRQYTCLTDGRLDWVEVRYDEAARWIAMRRGDLEIVCNFGEPQPIPTSGHSVLLCSESDSLADGSSIRLPSEAVAIVAHSESTKHVQAAGSRN